MNALSCAPASTAFPLVSAHADFKKVLGGMRLQARGTGGVDSASTGGMWDISNADRVGKGEVQLCNILMEGIAQLTKWENEMENGKTEDVNKEVEALVAKGAEAA